MKKYFSTVKIIVLAIVLTTGLSFTYASWTNPTATPPWENVDAPINVSTTAQVKTGKLTVGSFQVTGGSPTTGKVLTAVDTTGTTAWTPPASAPYKVLCKNDAWQCASAAGQGRELTAEITQGTFNLVEARKNATRTCVQNGHSYVGFTYNTHGTSCGQWYHVSRWNGSSWGWVARNCGGSVVVIDSIYCQQTEVILPSNMQS